MAVNGRKYGLGKYGANSYDLGVAHELPPWVPVPGLPGEIWIPTVDAPPWCEQPPSMSGSEIWSPVASAPSCWGAEPVNNKEMWKPLTMPFSGASNG